MGTIFHIQHNASIDTTVIGRKRRIREIMYHKPRISGFQQSEVIQMNFKELMPEMSKRNRGHALYSQISGQTNSAHTKLSHQKFFKRGRHRFGSVLWIRDDIAGVYLMLSKCIGSGAKSSCKISGKG